VTTSRIDKTAWSYRNTANIIEKTAVNSLQLTLLTVNGDPPLIHTSKTATMAQFTKSWIYVPLPNLVKIDAVGVSR